MHSFFVCSPVLRSPRLRKEEPGASTLGGGTFGPRSPGLRKEEAAPPRVIYSF